MTVTLHNIYNLGMFHCSVPMLSTWFMEKCWNGIWFYLNGRYSQNTSCRTVTVVSDKSTYVICCGGTLWTRCWKQGITVEGIDNPSSLPTVSHWLCIWRKLLHWTINPFDRLNCQSHRFEWGVLVHNIKKAFSGVQFCYWDTAGAAAAAADSFWLTGLCSMLPSFIDLWYIWRLQEQDFYCWHACLTNAQPTLSESQFLKALKFCHVSDISLFCCSCSIMTTCGDCTCQSKCCHCIFDTTTYLI